MEAADKVLQAIALFDQLEELKLSPDELESALWASDFEGPLRVSGESV